MGMGGSDQDGLSSEINVTPLVDVMLVLLVIFMITAPMMNTGVDIDLPETNTVATDESEGRLVLSIGRGRQLYLGATKVSWEELPEKLKTNQRVQSEELYIEADKDLPYSVVVTAMAVAQENGVRKLQMMTEVNPNIDLVEIDRSVVGSLKDDG
jgi:biopolymer transport protein TolR